MGFVQKCSKCGAGYPKERMVCSCFSCGGRIEIVYDYDRIKENLTRREDMLGRLSLWQYSDLLPIVDKTKRISLGEGGTDLTGCRKLANKLGLKRLYVKDETRNPTGSFKDRCSAVSISKALESSVNTVAIASSGNAGASACAYSAKAGVTCYVFVPASVDVAKLSQIMIYGGRVVRVEGTLGDCHLLTNKASSKYGWQEITTNSQTNIYSTQGSKTAAFEICMQLGWESPDWFVVPFGGGGNLFGHWLGFQEFLRLGFIQDMPRLAAIQAAGCAPFVRVFRERMAPNQVETWKKPETIASGIACTYPYDIDVALPAVHQSNGTAEAVTDEEILEAEVLLAKTEGIFVEPSAASSIAGLRKLIESGTIERNDLVVCEITGNGLKDIKSAMRTYKDPVTIAPTLEELERVLQFRSMSSRQ